MFIASAPEVLLLFNQLPSNIIKTFLGFNNFLLLFKIQNLEKEKFLVKK